MQPNWQRSQLTSFLIIITFGLFGLLFMFGARAHAQTIEPPLDQAEVSNITISAVSPTGAMIAWDSNQERDFWLQYGTQPDFAPPYSVLKAERLSVDGTYPAHYAATPNQLNNQTLYYFQIYTYASDDPGHPRYFSSPFSYLQKFSTTSGVPDLTPRVNYWYGKVNQHVDYQGNWQTDPDGTSGANIDKLAYCKKWYPQTVRIEDYHYETIVDWKAAGNTGSYAGTHMSTECIQAAELPDLVVENITYHEHWEVWDDVLTATVCNRGTAPSPAVQTYTQFSVLNGRATHGFSEGLNPDECLVTFSLVNQLMQNWYPTHYPVTVQADTNESGPGNNVVVESNEENNKLTTTLLIANTSTSPKIALNLPQGGETWITGKTYTINWTQRNVDMISIGYSKQYGHLDWITNAFPVDIHATQGSYDWTLPSSLPPGNEYTIQIIGYHVGIGSILAKSNAFTIANPSILPDLITENFSYKLSPGSSWDVQLEFDLVNIGQGSAPDKPFTLLVHNEQNGIILKSETYAGLYFEPDYRAHVYVMGKIGQGFDYGTNPIMISVDHNKDIDESDETNNLSQQRFVIDPPPALPDFGISDIAIRKDPQAGHKRYIYATVINQGDRPLPAGQILSVRVLDLDTGDEYFSGVTDDFVTGYQKEIVMAMPLRSKKSDIYRLRAYADNINSFTEKDEANNTREEFILKNGKEPQYPFDDTTVMHHINRLRELRERGFIGTDKAEFKELKRQLEDIFRFYDDSDNDDLPDYWEQQLGTNPQKKDSDRDGHKDGTEVLNGYNPLGK